MVPDPKASSEGFAVLRHAMAQANKVAIGEVAFAGREHLIAIALSPDKKARGLMVYTLRYAEELRDAKDYFAGIEEHAIDKKHLALASELIRTHSAPFELKHYKDDYEERPQSSKVVSLMDALRRSVDESKHQGDGRRRPSLRSSRKGPTIVKPGRRTRRAA
jgi:DNA end-binding protein Ku